ncbi:MAG: hypothetical protein MRZ79_11905 [Bacteroidia bacterium]|nr:hypothetical protein [Bacteroidia bacterium]
MKLLPPKFACWVWVLAFLAFPFSVHSKGIILKGSIDTPFNSNTDSIYIGVVWHSEDNWAYKATYSNAIGIVKNGKFRLKIEKPPEDSSCIILKNSKLSIGFIFAFKDKDDDGEFTDFDEIIGISEGQSLAFVEGDFLKDIREINKKKKDKIDTLLRLKKGIQLCKVIKTAEDKSGKYSSGFDDFIPAKKINIQIKTPSKIKRRLRTPNWT